MLIGIVILLLGTVGILIYQAHKSQIATNQLKQASVSGRFDINGVIPAGSSITLTQKPLGVKNATPKIFASNLPVADQSPWSFDKAIEGVSYEIQANLVVNGSVVSASSPLSVTAPADDETLTLDIESTTHTPNAQISGNILVDGYIPAGATITIKGRKLGSQTFTTVASNLTGSAHQFMSYTTALSGVTYEVEGLLLDKTGKTIGTSNILAVTAPAVNEALVINSSAQPTVTPTPVTPTSIPSQNLPTPVPQPVSSGAVISGGINFNGASPSNSRIVIFQQANGASSNAVAVNNVSPVDGSTWSWNGAASGTWYTLIAVLKQHNSNGTDTDLATSAPVIIAAPATNVIFTINSGASIPQPTGQATVTCQTYNGGPNQNNWNVQIAFPPVSGAQSYWYQVGTNNGGNNTLNTANTSNTVNLTLGNNTTYYARYAYANVSSTPLGSSQWSPFSSTSTLQCSH